MFSVTLLSCAHNPKITRLKGIVHNNHFEILVCKNCSTDTDLQDFREEKL